MKVVENKVGNMVVNSSTSGAVGSAFVVEKGGGSSSPGRRNSANWTRYPNSAMEIKWANAPISWGVNEFGLESGMRPSEMLDELALAGYSGTELGDHGFFPTENSELTEMIGSKQLDMIGAFVCYSLWDPSTHEKGREYARKVAKQLKSFDDKNLQDHQPHIVLSDSVVHPNRIQMTGKITKSMSLKRKEWQILIDEVRNLKKIIKEEFGLEVHFHPHCGSFIETPWEIEALVRDVEGLQLILDTAHITMGAQARPMYCIEFLKNYPEKVYSFHFKDYDSNVLGKDYFELVNNGCFPELGCGIVDFVGIRDWQRQNDFKGYITIEQDILGKSKSSPLQSAVRNMSFLQVLYSEEMLSKL